MGRNPLPEARWRRVGQRKPAHELTVTPVTGGARANRQDEVVPAKAAISSRHVFPPAERQSGAELSQDGTRRSPTTCASSCARVGEPQQPAILDRHMRRAETNQARPAELGGGRRRRSRARARATHRTQHRVDEAPGSSPPRLEGTNRARAVWRVPRRLEITLNSRAAAAHHAAPRAACFARARAVALQSGTRYRLVVAHREFLLPSTASGVAPER